MKLDQQKDIEKIAKILYGHYCGEDKCDECKQPHCIDYVRAERLVNEGIGEVKQAKKDVLIDLEAKLLLLETHNYTSEEVLAKILDIVDELYKSS